MRAFLFVLAVLTGLMAFAMLVAALTKGGSDIQIIAAGVFLVAAVSCVGFAALLGRLEQPKSPEQPAVLARELLQRWEGMDDGTRVKLARTLIARLDPASEQLSTLNAAALRSRLSSLV